MGRERDPLVRKAKQEAMSPEILAKNSQLLIERQLRLVWRINEIKPDATDIERERQSDDTGMQVQKADPPAVRLLFQMWDRYYRLLESPEQDNQAINQVLGHIARLTSELEETKNKAFQQILQVVDHNRKLQEHADQMRVAEAKLKMNPDAMATADLEALATLGDNEPIVVLPGNEQP